MNWMKNIVSMICAAIGAIIITATTPMKMDTLIVMLLLHIIFMQESE